MARNLFHNRKQCHRVQYFYPKVGLPVLGIKGFSPDNTLCIDGVLGYNDTANILPTLSDKFVQLIIAYYYHFNIDFHLDT